MMKKVYCIKDRLQGFLSPFTDTNDEVAMRNFDAGCKNNNIIYFNPEEFSLWRVGEFDTDSGQLVSLPSPLFLMEAIDHRKENENE